MSGKPAEDRYELDCTDCSFQSTVGGGFAGVFDVIEAHREEQDAGPTEHFVNVHRVSGSEE